MVFFKSGMWPYQTVPSEEIITWADQRDLKKQVNELIYESFTNLQKRIVTVWGYFGSGKSHKLFYIKKNVEGSDGIAIYSPIPENPKNFGEIYKSLFFDQIFNKFLDKFLVFISDPQHDKIDVLKNEISRTITNGNSAFTLALMRLASIIKTSGTESVEINQIRNWFRGESLNKQTREWIGQKLKDDIDFINATIVIIKIILYDKNNRKPIFWIIDDCHYLSEIGNVKFRSIQKGFLDIYNLSPNGFILIFAFAGGTENVVDLIPDLLSRRDRRINVHILDKKQALTYIRELNSDVNVIKKDHDNKYYPLTEESAEK